MTPIVRITALTVFALTFTLLALGCSNKSSDDSAADSGEIRLVDGEVLLIKSATHDMDTTLNVVADRVEYRQPAVAFVVSWDSSPELHAIVSENVGKKLRIITEENRIIAAEELDGKRRFFSEVSAGSAPKATDQSTGTSPSQSEVGSVMTLIEPQGRWVLYKRLEKSDLYFEEIRDLPSERKTRRLLEYSDETPFTYPIYSKAERRGASAVADAVVTTFELNCREKTRSVVQQTFYIGLLTTLRPIVSYRESDPIFDYNVVFSSYKEVFGSYLMHKGNTEMTRDFFLSACEGVSYESLPNAPQVKSGPPVFGQGS
jgi:hypothetical protein